MGTRSLTHFKDDGKDVACIYRQYDGYPSGMGTDLIAFATKMNLINGIGGDDNTSNANGAGCYFAQLLTALKTETGIGGIYMEPVGTGDAGQEYDYVINIVDDGIYITCKSAYSDDEGYEFKWKKDSEFPDGKFVEGNAD